MTVKINELVIRARIEKNDDFSQKVSEKPKENEKSVTLKKPVEILSINKIKRER